MTAVISDRSAKYVKAAPRPTFVTAGENVGSASSFHGNNRCLALLPDVPKLWAEVAGNECFFFTLDDNIQSVRARLPTLREHCSGKRPICRSHQIRFAKSCFTFFGFPMRRITPCT